MESQREAMLATRKRVFVIALAVLLAPALAFALDLNVDYPPFGGIDINDDKNQSIPALIAWLYLLILGIAGFAAFLMIVWGGVRWMTSTGNPTIIGDAKDRIKSAVLGLLLVLSSFLILQVVNPELLTLRTVNLPGIKPGPPIVYIGPGSSSGAPPSGQQAQCVGPNSFEESGATSLAEMAQRICEQYGRIPVDAVLHAELSSVAKCLPSDVVAVRERLESQTDCGAAQGGAGLPGETVGGITIDQTTIPASLCSYIPGPEITSGKIFGPEDVPKTISFIPGLHNPDDALPLLQENIVALAQWCKGKNNPFCVLRNPEKTPIRSLNEEQQKAVAQYCADILPRRP